MSLQAVLVDYIGLQVRRCLGGPRGLLFFLDSDVKRKHWQILDVAHGQFGIPQCDPGELYGNQDLRQVFIDPMFFKCKKHLKYIPKSPIGNGHAIKPKLVLLWLRSCAAIPSNVAVPGHRVCSW